MDGEADACWGPPALNRDARFALIGGVKPSANALIGSVVVIVVKLIGEVVVILVELPPGLVPAAWDVAEITGATTWLNPVGAAFGVSALRNPVGPREPDSAGVP